MSLPISMIQNTFGKNLRRVEAYRRQHNEMGKKFRDGEITESEWLKFKKQWKADRAEVLRAFNGSRNTIRLMAKDFPLQTLKDRIRYPAEYTTLEQRYSYIWALRSQIRTLEKESAWSNVVEQEYSLLQKEIRELETVDD